MTSSVDALVARATRGQLPPESTSWREGLSRFLADLAKSRSLLPGARVGIEKYAVTTLRARFAVESWLADHPAAATAPVESPLFILGMPRAGTTLLLNLLLAALISWNPADPSLNATSGAAPTNWLGLNGALFADLFMQSLGLAAWPAALLLIAFGLAAAIGDAVQQRLKPTPVKSLSAIGGVLALSAALSAELELTKQQTNDAFAKVAETIGSMQSQQSQLNLTDAKLAELTDHLLARAGERQVAGGRLGAAHTLGGPGVVSTVAVLGAP